MTPRINWNYFFQSINSTTGKIVVITDINWYGFTFEISQINLLLIESCLNKKKS